MANGEAEAKPVAAAAPDEPMDVNTAVQNVLKKALAYDGLARGLHETARALDRGEASTRSFSCLCCYDCNAVFVNMFSGMLQIHPLCKSILARAAQAVPASHVLHHA